MYSLTDSFSLAAGIDVRAYLLGVAFRPLADAGAVAARSPIAVQA